MGTIHYLQFDFSLPITVLRRLGLSLHKSDTEHNVLVCSILKTRAFSK